jgi:hypothetical protein
MSNLNYGPIFMPGDAVYYAGEKHKQELSNKEGKPYKGWIHAAVNGQPGTFVVWFPDTKEQDSYVLHASLLTKARPPKTESKECSGPVVEHMPIRRKASED